jgi:hypothetical protein
MLSEYTDLVARRLRKERGLDRDAACAEAERQIDWALRTNGLLYGYYDGGLFLTELSTPTSGHERFDRFRRAMNTLLVGTHHILSARCLEVIIMDDAR